MKKISAPMTAGVAVFKQERGGKIVNPRNDRENEDFTLCVICAIWRKNAMKKVGSQSQCLFKRRK